MWSSDQIGVVVNESSQEPPKWCLWFVDFNLSTLSKRRVSKRNSVSRSSYTLVHSKSNKIELIFLSIHLILCTECKLFQHECEFLRILFLLVSMMRLATSYFFHNYENISHIYIQECRITFQKWSYIMCLRSNVQPTTELIFTDGVKYLNKHVVS